MKRYEYKTITVEAKSLHGVKYDVDKPLNEMGRLGWRLVEKTTFNEALDKTRYVICTLEREIV